jgi:hypothetical protein
VPHISLVFREMWDSTNPQPLALQRVFFPLLPTLSSPNILPILIAQPNRASRAGPSLREFLDEKIQSAGGASNLLSHTRETE